MDSGKRLKTMDRKKYIFFSAAFLFLSAVHPFPADAQYRTDGGYSGLYDSETAASMRRHVSDIASAANRGRKAGSDGETTAAAYLYDALKNYGVEMLSPESGDEFGISRASGDTLTSRNVVGFVQGYDARLRNRYVVVGARLDNLGTNVLTVDGKQQEQIYYGANGNASGLAMMIELARMVSTNSILFRRSVIFIGLGASCETFAGSWYFLNRSFADADAVDVMINLDMLGTGDEGFYAYTASNADLNSILASMSAELQPVHPDVVSYEPYPSDHRAFYAAEIPSVYFTTGQYPQHNTPKDTGDIIDYGMMERELEFIYNFTVNVANTDDQIAFRPEEKTVENASGRDDVIPYYECDFKPAFLNSTDPRQFLTKWVYPYLKYPAEAVRDGIQGTVQVNFVIDKDGKVRDVEVVKSVDPLLDAEAVKVISASPKWRPARVNGQKVNSSMTLPVEFRLEKKSKGGGFGINGRRQSW